MPMRWWPLLNEIWVLFRKDLLQELRSKAALNAIFLFALVTLTAVSYSIGSFNVAPDMLAALLWIVIVFSGLSAFAHIFLKEEEAQTADTLKLIARPTAIFLAKWAFNVLLLTLMLLFTVPLFIGAFNFTVYHPGLLILTLLLGDIGLATAGTIIAVLIARAARRGALFSVLSFPVLLPVMIIAISATKIAFRADPTDLFISEITAMLSFDIVLLTASLLLFEFIWND